MMGDEVLAETLVKMFVANTPDDIARLGEMIGHADADAVRAAAHLVRRLLRGARRKHARQRIS